MLVPFVLNFQPYPDDPRCIGWFLNTASGGTGPLSAEKGSLRPLVHCLLLISFSQPETLPFELSLDWSMSCVSGLPSPRRSTWLQRDLFRGWQMVEILQQDAASHPQSLGYIGMLWIWYHIMQANQLRVDKVVSLCTWLGSDALVQLLNVLKYCPVLQPLVA